MAPPEPRLATERPINVGLRSSTRHLQTVFASEPLLHMCLWMRFHLSQTSLKALSSPARKHLHISPRKLTVHNILPRRTAFFTQLVEPARHNEKTLCCVEPQLGHLRLHILVWSPRPNIEIAAARTRKCCHQLPYFSSSNVIWLTLGFRTSASNLLLKDLLQTLLTASPRPCAVLLSASIFVKRTCLKPNAPIECQQSLPQVCGNLFWPSLITTPSSNYRKTLLVSDDHRLRETDNIIFSNRLAPCTSRTSYLKCFSFSPYRTPPTQLAASLAVKKKQTRDVTSIVLALRASHKTPMPHGPCHAHGPWNRAPDRFCGQSEVLLIFAYTKNEDPKCVFWRFSTW